MTFDNIKEMVQEQAKFAARSSTTRSPVEVQLRFDWIACVACAHPCILEGASMHGDHADASAMREESWAKHLGCELPTDVLF